MFKLFTLASANRLIPTVEARLGELQVALADLEELRARCATVPPGTVRAYGLQQEATFVAGSVADAREALAALGVAVPDVKAGVVEFPSRIGSEVVHLLWQRDEQRIQRYQRLTGDRATKPLRYEGPPAAPERALNSDAGTN